MGGFLDEIKPVSKGCTTLLMIILNLCESILVEYHPEDPIHIIFKEALGYPEYYNYNPLILDVFDTLHLIKEQLRVMGMGYQKDRKVRCD